jgi:hypothetical protein
MTVLAPTLRQLAVSRGFVVPVVREIAPPRSPAGGVVS